MMSGKSTMRTTISAAIIAGLLAGCASTSNRVVSRGFGGRSNADLGLATRALAALSANNVVEAIALAERAVEKTPADAGFRTLLGNTYFAAGRFRSAEQAYKDALSIYANQPQTILRLALVQIAQGKGAEAIQFLEAGRDVLDPADVGLAMALAGRAQDAVALLDQAARSNTADSRVRQNLALAYALAGDWQQARIIAAQDVPAAELDARLQQWMGIANPVRPSDQVAALVGVSPAQVDPGQPVRLALVKQDTRLAEAAPVAAPVAEPAPAAAPLAVPVAEAAPVAVPQPIEQQVAAVEAQLAPVPPAPEPEPAFAAVVPPAPPPPNPMRVAASSPAEVPMALAETARQMLPKVRAAVSQARPKVRRASAPAAGKSGAVVQLGAYRSASRVLVAWDAAAKRFEGLRDYAPVSARFEGPKGTVYRLSVKGFASRAEATALCSGLRRSGGSCFVRNAAGDRPIQFASR